MSKHEQEHQGEHKLQEQALLARSVPGDRLMLADDTLVAALEGDRALTPNERRALQGSPQTLRRFRELALARRHAMQDADAPRVAANDDAWTGSAGMLRAAASSAALEELVTDDGHWRLHFVFEGGPQRGTASASMSGNGWQLILKLDAAAPFAARLLREHPLLRVVDGGGAILLQGRLDADGECECAWPFDDAPLPHFQHHGARFAVLPTIG